MSLEERIRRSVQKEDLRKRQRAVTKSFKRLRAAERAMSIAQGRLRLAHEALQADEYQLQLSVSISDRKIVEQYVERRFWDYCL